MDFMAAACGWRTIFVRKDNEMKRLYMGIGRKDYDRIMAAMMRVYLYMRHEEKQKGKAGL
jgi:hypothetical protein